MNSSDQILKNKTITFLPKFDGIQIFRESQYIVFIQNETRITIPVQMSQAILNAIEKAVD